MDSIGPKKTDNSSIVTSQSKEDKTAISDFAREVQKVNPGIQPAKSNNKTSIDQSLHSMDVKTQETSRATSLKPEMEKEFIFQPIKLADRVLGTLTTATADDFFSDLYILDGLQDKGKMRVPVRNYESRVDAIYEALVKKGSEDWYLLLGKFHPKIPLEFDETFFPNAPRIHTQVILECTEQKLNANRICYDNKSYGIAITGKEACKVGNMLEMSEQEGIGIFVDLSTPIDPKKAHTKNELEADTDKFWGEITQDTTKNYGPYAIELVENFKNDWTDVTYYEVKNKNTGKSKEICRIHYLQWPDLAMLGIENLKNLHINLDEIEEYLPDSKGLAVNCLGGLGRTGTFFATRCLRDKAKSGNLNNEQLNAETFSILTQGHMARNMRFVQTLEQALGVREFANDPLGKDEP